MPPAVQSVSSRLPENVAAALREYQETTLLRGSVGLAGPQAVAPAVDAAEAAGFDALEALIARHGAGWSFGDAPTLVDCYLIPQMYSARRFNMDLSPWPRLLAVEQTALAHPAFASAHPDLQPDADA